jgi:uncharacterized RDD family membrane protein YckC
VARQRCGAPRSSSVIHFRYNRFVNDSGPQSRWKIVVLRVAAIVLDLLLVFFVALGLASLIGKNVQLAVTIVIVASFLYRLAFSATPGQQIMGLRRERNSFGHSSIVRARKRGLATFAIALVAIVYLGLTFGAGALVRTLTNAKLSSNAIGVRVVPWTRLSHSNLDLTQWIDGAVLSLPRAVNGWRAEIASCCVFYGPYSTEVLQPGLMVTVLKTNHPFEFCRGAVNPWARYLAGCADGPLQFQRGILQADAGYRNRALTPVAVVRRNFALVAKSQTFQDANADQEVRVFHNDDTEIVWIRGTLTLHKGAVALKAPVDHFLLANGTDCLGIDLVWKSIARNESLAEQIASSLALKVSHQVRQEQARQGGEIPRLYNEARLTNYAIRPLNDLVHAVETSGTQRERKYLASRLRSLAEKDPKVSPLAGKTANW